VEKRLIRLRAGGDALGLLEWAVVLSKDLGWSREQQQAVTREMRGGDYAHLESVFVRHFGAVAELVRETSPPPG
jgi:hypothetical protein